MKYYFIFIFLLSINTINTGDYIKNITQGLNQAKIDQLGNQGTIITLTRPDDTTVCLTINAELNNCSIKTDQQYKQLSLHRFVLILRACKLKQGQDDVTQFADKVQSQFSINSTNAYNAILAARIS